MTQTDEPTHSLIMVVNAAKALKGEAALKRAGIESALIPLPRSVSQECGVCLRVTLVDRERAAAALEAAGVQPSAIHDLDT
jgi:hypothetical protein